MGLFSRKRFHINPPKNWTMDVVNKALVIYYSPEDFEISKKKKIIRLSVSIYGDKRDLKSTAREHFELRKNSLKDFEFIHRKDVKVADMPAYMTKYTYTDDEYWGRTIAVKMVEFIRKNRHHVIEFFGTEQDYPENVKTFHKILKTIRFA